MKPQVYLEAIFQKYIYRVYSLICTNKKVMQNNHFYYFLSYFDHYLKNYVFSSTLRWLTFTQ